MNVIPPPSQRTLFALRLIDEVEATLAACSHGGDERAENGHAWCARCGAFKIDTPWLRPHWRDHIVRCLAEELNDKTPGEPVALSAADAGRIVDRLEAALKKCKHPYVDLTSFSWCNVCGAMHVGNPESYEGWMLPRWRERIAVTPMLRRR